MSKGRCWDLHIYNRKEHAPWLLITVTLFNLCCKQKEYWRKVWNQSENFTHLCLCFLPPSVVAKVSRVVRPILCLSIKSERELNTQAHTIVVDHTRQVFSDSGLCGPIMSFQPEVLIRVHHCCWYVRNWQWVWVSVKSSGKDNANAVCSWMFYLLEVLPCCWQTKVQKLSLCPLNISHRYEFLECCLYH